MLDNNSNYILPNKNLENQKNCCNNNLNKLASEKILLQINDTSTILKNITNNLDNKYNKNNISELGD